MAAVRCQYGGEVSVQRESLSGGGFCLWRPGEEGLCPEGSVSIPPVNRQILLKTLPSLAVGNNIKYFVLTIVLPSDVSKGKLLGFVDINSLAIWR